MAVAYDIDALPTLDENGNEVDQNGNMISEESSEEEGPPDLEDGPPGLEDGPPSLVDAKESSAVGKGVSPKDQMNRSEKKARKAISKLNGRPISGITRLSIKQHEERKGEAIWVIEEPTVFMVPNTTGSAYICFGNARQQQSAPPPPQEGMSDAPPSSGGGR
ncbi:hypothetical protein TrRE_jg1101, partial [Triparma retinervis]